MNDLNDRQQALLHQLLHSGAARSDLESILETVSSQEWEKLLENQQRTTSVSAVSSGTNIILKGGRGKKRQFNGNQALEVECPQCLSWMTVRVCSDTDDEADNRVLKWRKLSYQVVKADGPTDSPGVGLQDLDDDSLAHVFGFLEQGVVDDNDPTNKGGRLLWVKDAARLHSLISSVCHQFRRFAEANLARVLGHIDANFDGLNVASVIPCILWLCKYRLLLGRIKIRFQLPDVPLLTRMLCDCNTNRVLYVQAYDYLCHKLDANESMKASRLITSTWELRFGGRVVNMTSDSNDRTIKEMASDLEIPFRATSRKELHDAIAEQCPELSHLLVDIKIAPDPSYHDFWRHSHFSPALFAMPSIRQLKLSIAFCVDHFNSGQIQVDSRFINAYIPCRLEKLGIGIGESCGYRRGFIIESTTLRSLHVERIRKGMWVYTICPNLGPQSADLLWNLKNALSSHP